MNVLRLALMCGLLLALVEGCRPCENGTLFLRLLYQGPRPDRIHVTLQQEGTSATREYDLIPKAREDSLAVRFSGAYPERATFVITVDGFDTAGTQITSGTDRVTLTPGCTVSTITVGEGLPDLGAPDLGPPLAPTHLPNINPDTGVCDLTIQPPSSGTPTFNTDTGELTGMTPPPNCIFTTQQQQTSSTPPQQFTVAVLIVRNLTIFENAILRITGTRPLAIVARERIQIVGILDGSANLNNPGPGGLATGPGAGNSGTSTSTSNGGVDSGGAGGSYGSFGADGATARAGSTTVNGGVRGATYNDDSLPISVEAGSAGGAGGDADANATAPCGLGGGGGGAIQLTAGYVLQIRGQVLANGGGGLGGCNKNAQGQGGGGGGSGGGLYFESRMLDLASGSVVAANGGGGGSGGDSLVRGNNGENGRQSATPAPGGTSPGTSGGDGGNGAAGNTLATSGPINLPNGGGGGGGVGRIVLRAQDMSTAGAIVSPPANSITF